MKPVLSAAVLSALLANPVLAQEASEGDEAAPVPQPPAIPPAVESGEALEPEVTIIETERGTVEEYRVSGRLYMVKINPSWGAPYYLLDTDGDGQLDARSDEPTNSSVNQWVLFRW